MLLNCSINSRFVDPMLQSSAYSWPMLNVLSVSFTVSVCFEYGWSCCVSLIVFRFEKDFMRSLDFSSALDSSRMKRSGLAQSPCGEPMFVVKVLPKVLSHFTWSVTSLISKLTKCNSSGFKIGLRWLITDPLCIVSKALDMSSMRM